MKLIDHFSNLTSNDFLKNQRQLAADSLKKMGLPTLKWEDWKYTSLNALIETEFERTQSLTSQVSFTSSHVFNESAHSIVFINGHFSKEHSHISTLPEGLQITSLKEALLNPSTIFKKTLGQISTFSKAPFAALNLSAFEDGCLVQVSKNVKIGSPIQILYLSEQKTPFMSFPRNLIVMEEGSEAQIIEAYEGSNIYFNNAVTEVQLAENAKLEYTKLQQESLNAFHIHQCTVHQTANSQFISTVIDLGARLARNDLNALLLAEGSHCQLNGLYMVSGSQHIDNHTNIEHHQAHGTSHEMYKGILDDHAQGVFNGRVLVKAKAEKTASKQMNKNLLLSQEAVMNTKPLLEIFHNDVKCNHGATIGRLDANQLFYLRSRGIDLDRARSILTYAFADEVLHSISMPSLRKKLEQNIFSKLMSRANLKDEFGGIE